MSRFQLALLGLEHSVYRYVPCPCCFGALIVAASCVKDLSGRAEIANDIVQLGGMMRAFEVAEIVPFEGPAAGGGGQKYDISQSARSAGES